MMGVENNIIMGVETKPKRDWERIIFLSMNRWCCDVKGLNGVQQS